jgi:CheY-like chemotaxis protein
MIVTDTGLGIAEADQVGLFEPFRQVDGSLTRRYGGTGLGLSIVKKATEQLQGEVSLESRPGEGTSVTVTLPCAFVNSSGADLAGAIDGPSVLLLGGSYSTIFRATLFVRSRGWRCTVISSPELLAAAVASASLPIGAAVADQRFGGDVLSLLDGIGGDDVPRWSTPTIILGGQEDPARGDPHYVVARIDRKFGDEVLVTKLRPLLEPEGSPALAAPPQHPPRAGAADFSSYGVLVVDDDPINRRVMQRLLNKLGVSRVKAAPGASEAYPMIEDEDFDVVLMDIQMPDIDGYTATRQIRAAGHTDLKVVACTAHAFDADVSRSREEGMDGHISKPVELWALESLLQRLADEIASGSASPRLINVPRDEEGQSRRGWV